MNRPLASILVTLQLAAAWVAVAQTDTGLSTSPHSQVMLANARKTVVPSNDRTREGILLTTHALDFGSVPVGSVNKLSFRVKNVGDAVLTGAAQVRAPFSIVEGGSYVLERPQSQVVTVQYAPRSIGMHMTVVHLADGATVTVMGCAVPPLHPAPARHRASPGHSGPRMIALR